jgi:serine/threonine protein kinase
MRGRSPLILLSKMNAWPQPSAPFPMIAAAMLPYSPHGPVPDAPPTLALFTQVEVKVKRGAAALKLTRMPMRTTLLSAIALLLVACARSARPGGRLGFDCEACETALRHERTERARLEFELAQLRIRFEMTAPKSVEAQPLVVALDRTIVAHARPPLQRPSRTLLREQPSDPQCSIAELLAVEADPTAAVTAMFSSNAGCAMCLVPCASAADAISCAVGCLNRDEGVCTAEDLAAIKAAGMPSSLAERPRLIRMLEVTSRACVRCIVETIAAVCGGDCVPERLHLTLDYTYTPRLCLPELAARLLVGEVAAFERAVAASEPFGLTAAMMPVLAANVSSSTNLISDLFIPSPGSGLRRKVYKGVDSGTLAYECDAAVHGRVWAVLPAATSSSANDPSWADCDGPLRIDLDSGEAHSQPAAADVSRVPIRFDLGWADCSARLPFDSIEPSASTKDLDRLTPPHAAACWLGQFFGPHAAWQGPSNFTVTLSSDSLALQTDLVVRSGTTLRIASSMNATIVVGPHQIRVETGARLEIEGLTIADSVASSALVVRGSASAVRCTFIRCTTATNLIVSGLFDTFVPDGVGAALASGGGAVYIAPRGAMEIVDSALLECGAAGAKVAALGGAIVVDSAAQLRVLRSELRRNYAAGGSYGCCGGAVCLLLDATAALRDSTVNENVARGGVKVTLGGAVGLFPNARLTVHGSEMCRNEATTSSEYAFGGAVYMHTAAHLVVSDSLLCQNRAKQTAVDNAVGGGGALGNAVVGGGAVAIYLGGLLTMERSVLQNNTAQGGLHAAGGAIYLLSLSKATFVLVTFVGNSAQGALLRNSGGAVSSSALELRVLDSEMRENVAIGQDPGGGAVSSAGSIVLVNTSLLRNRVAVAAGSGYGGAMRISGGNVHLNACRVHGNVAESRRGGDFAAAGGIYVGAGDVHIERSHFTSHRMGGLGAVQADWSKPGGAHIVADGGHVALDGCSVTDDAHDGEDAEPQLANPAEWWIFATESSQSLALRNSSFRSAAPGQGLLRLVAPQLQLLIRGCTLENVVIGVAANASVPPIGIVDSTFDPGLDPSVPTVLPSIGEASCGVQLAGERLCDPRALCEGAKEGGVRCSCVGAGLQSKHGVREDGRQCEQQTSINLLTQTRSVAMTVQKPSVRAGAVDVVFTAAGEIGFTASYNMSMTRVRPTDGTTQLQGLNSAYEWMSIGQQRMSMDGHHVVWQGNPPSADSAVDLSFDAGRFTFSRTFALSIELKCTAGDACIEDGDVVLTRVTAASAADGLVSEVMISTTVESLVSCNHSVAWVEGLRPDELSVSVQTPLKVHIEAFDCDERPINFTRSDLEFSFGGTPLSVTWSRGSNHYTADVPSALPGRYELIVSASNGWDGRRVTKCVLLSHTIDVVPEANAQPVIIAVSAASTLAALVVLSIIVLRWYRRKLQNEATKLAAHRAKAYLEMSRLWDSTAGTWMPNVLVTAGTNPQANVATRAAALPMWSRVSSLWTLRVPSLGLVTTLRVDLVDKYGYLPLHCAVSEGASLGMVEKLIAAFGEAASVGDAKQNLPLHLAVINGAALAAVKAVYAAFPDAVVTRNGNGQLPIQLLVHSTAYAPREVIELAQLLAFPIDCNGRCANWFYLLQKDETQRAGARRGTQLEVAINRVADFVPGASLLRRELGDATKERVETSVLVSSILDVAPLRSVTIEALAHATDKNGRRAIEVATHASKRCIWRRLFLLGRYEKKKLLHESATSRVWEVEDKEAEHEPLKVLALKEIRDEAHYEREISVVAKHALSEEYVVHVVRCHAPDRILVMENGLCSLEDALCNQNIAAVSSSAVRVVIEQLVMSLMHLHSRGILHGDVKAKNICHFRSSWKLIDFDSAARIGGIVGAKMVPGQSPSNSPPELARLLLRTSHSAKSIRARLSSDASLSDTARFEWESCLAIVEQLDGQGLDPLACTVDDAAPSFDVWGLGLILYRLFTAFRLFNTDQQEELDEGELRKLVLWQGVVPAELRKRIFAKASPGSVASSEKDAAVLLISACLHPDPMCRPQNVGDLLESEYFHSHSSALKAKVLFVSTPGRGRNPSTGEYDVDVMGWLQQLCRHYAGGFVVAYDWAGSSSADPRDTKWFNRIFEDRDASCLSLFDRWRMAPTEEERERLIDAVELILYETRWLASYKGSIKAQIREACQSGAKAILVRLEGGPITRVEARLMAQLISEARADLTQLGLSSVAIELHAHESVFDFANAIAAYTSEVYGDESKPIPAHLLALLRPDSTASRGARQEVRSRTSSRCYVLRRICFAADQSFVISRAVIVAARFRPSSLALVVPTGADWADRVGRELPGYRRYGCGLKAHICERSVGGRSGRC